MVPESRLLSAPLPSGSLRIPDCARCFSAGVCSDNRHGGPTREGGGLGNPREEGGPAPNCRVSEARWWQKGAGEGTRWAGQVRLPPPSPQEHLCKPHSRGTEHAEAVRGDGKDAGRPLSSCLWSAGGPFRQGGQRRACVTQLLQGQVEPRTKCLAPLPAPHPLGQPPSPGPVSSPVSRQVLCLLSRRRQEKERAAKLPTGPDLGLCLAPICFCFPRQPSVLSKTTPKQLLLKTLRTRESISQSHAGSTVHKPEISLRGGALNDILIARRPENVAPEVMAPPAQTPWSPLPHGFMIPTSPSLMLTQPHMECVQGTKGTQEGLPLGIWSCT